MARKYLDYARYLMLPGLGIFFAILAYNMRGGTLAKSFPYFDTFVTTIVMLTLERVWTYRHAVSQRHMIWRDMISTIMQSFFLGAIVASVVLPILHFIPESFLGRRILFGLSDALGPVWLQVAVAFLLTSFWQYWVHRYEHTNDFLWKLHGYHHSVTNVQISNVLVSNPLDYTFRNILGGLILSIVGFNPVAVVIAGALTLGYGGFSHSGTDAKGGWLNYIFNGPEVHRWHHATAFPDDSKFRYGCNFGVSTTFWDQLFGTFYLPLDEHGDALAPAAMGHPEGYPDEGNYLKMLLAARCFPWLDRLLSGKQKEDQSITVPAE
jgi:sterol desaturase/sphingolipid hydroxylase (fatty acid hydroxylase superfamily)